MGAKTPAAGGETKPVVKHEDRPPYHGGRNNANKYNKYNYNAREKSLGADADLHGKLSSDSNASYDTELEDLMFIQPHIHSQGEKQRVCSKNLILKTWIL